MPTVQKSVRVDKDLIIAFDSYKAAMKKMHKITISLNSLLESCLIKGFYAHIQSLRLIQDGSWEEMTGQKIELPPEALETLSLMNNLYYNLMDEESISVQSNPEEENKNV